MHNDQLNGTLLDAYLAPRPTVGSVFGTATLRSQLEDFQVVELPAFLPSGTGEHFLVRVQKRNANTEWVASQLSHWAAVPRRAVGYGGRKDRRAVTEQWFSIHLPGKLDPAVESFSVPDVTILETARHHRKLQRGALRGNAFRITLREVAGKPALVEKALEQISLRGFANYFGDQRFGREAQNLLAWHVRKKSQRGNRNQRGMMLSAARSFLFNQVLAARVLDGSWEQPLQGDVLALHGTQRWFSQSEPIDQNLRDRALCLDIHPTGPLWGRGDPATEGRVRELETSQVQPFETLRLGLERAGLRQERRALRSVPSEMSWSWRDDGVLEVAFQLSRGCFATTLLEGLWELREAPILNADDDS